MGLSLCKTAQLADEAQVCKRIQLADAAQAFRSTDVAQYYNKI
jgi:hypothetical protein